MTTDFIPTWSDFKDYATKRIDELHKSLESALPSNVPALQGEIRAWRQVLDMPAIMLTEAANARDASLPEISGY